MFCPSSESAPNRALTVTSTTWRQGIMTHSLLWMPCRGSSIGVNNGQALPWLPFNNNRLYKHSKSSSSSTRISLPKWNLADAWHCIFETISGHRCFCADTCCQYFGSECHFESCPTCRRGDETRHVPCYIRDTRQMRLWGGVDPEQWKRRYGELLVWTKDHVNE